MVANRNFGIVMLLVIIAISMISINDSHISGSTAADICSKTLIKNVALGANLTSEFDTEIDRNDICLFEGEVNLQSDSANTKEILVLGHRGKFIGPATALTSNQKYDDVVLEIKAGSIKLYYIFDTSLDLTQASADSPLEIKFLGKLYRISKIVSDTKFSALVGDSYLLKIGDVVKIGNTSIQLLRVGQNGAIILGVDDKTVLLSRGSTERIDGVEVTNRESFYDSSNLLNNFADLVIGPESLISVSDGEKYNNETGWVWNIGGLTSKTSTITSTSAEFSGPFIGIENTFEYGSKDDNPPKAGQCINLPDKYVSICFDGLTQEKYIRLEINVETADLSAAGGGASETTTHFKIFGHRLRVGGVGTNEVWITSDNRLYYDRDDVKSASFDGTNVATIEDLKITKSDSTFTIVSPRAGDGIVFTFSGSSLSTATWNSRNIKDMEGKLITRQGVIVRVGNDLDLQVPRDQVKAIVNITSRSS